MRICVVGAGFSGAVIARSLSEAGFQVLVVDERHHAAGNCHTDRDAETGVLLHVYGPHIFHTDNKTVWDYMCRFGEMVPYINRVKANVKGQIFSLPINLHTINQFFGKSFSPTGAREFIETIARTDISDPQTFEEQALRFIGEDLYKAFFYGYTCKQWGVEPDALPASILKRLPVRFSYNDNYYHHLHQGMPRNGYTAIVENILAAEGVELRLGCAFEDLDETFEHTVYTGPLDRYFAHDCGRLGYRTLDFERIDFDGDYQGTAVINYCDIDVPFNRIIEHKHFSPWDVERQTASVCYREFSRACLPDDIPFYPIRLVDEKAMLADYVARAQNEANVTFVGRLGTYSYIDMDVAIARALETADVLERALRTSGDRPVFVHPPL